MGDIKILVPDISCQKSRYYYYVAVSDILELLTVLLESFIINLLMQVLGWVGSCLQQHHMINCGTM